MDAGERCLPRHASPIAERDAFVIFDDARCRGADLQLRLGAVGLLTLGPGIGKDKVMQAAGRLRQLASGGQGLRFAAPADVAAKIAAAAGLDRPGEPGAGSGSAVGSGAGASGSAPAAGLAAAALPLAARRPRAGAAGCGCASSATGASGSGWASSFSSMGGAASASAAHSKSEYSG